MLFFVSARVGFSKTGGRKFYAAKKTGFFAAWSERRTDRAALFFRRELFFETENGLIYKDFRIHCLYGWFPVRQPAQCSAVCLRFRRKAVFCCHNFGFSSLVLLRFPFCFLRLLFLAVPVLFPSFIVSCWTVNDRVWCTLPANSLKTRRNCSEIIWKILRSMFVELVLLIMMSQPYRKKSTAFRT